MILTNLISVICWFCFLMLYEYYKTPLHEYIHFYYANKYFKCKAITYSQFNYKESESRIEWRKQDFFAHPKGLTVVDNDFLVYSDKEIKKIAVMPLAICFAFYLSFMGIVTVGIMHINFFLIRIKTWLPLLLFSIYALLYIFNTICAKSSWSDFKIFLNPKGFKEYMKHEHETNGKDSYNYIKIKGLN